MSKPPDPPGGFLFGRRDTERHPPLNDMTHEEIDTMNIYDDGRCIDSGEHDLFFSDQPIQSPSDCSCQGRRPCGASSKSGPS